MTGPGVAGIRYRNCDNEGLICSKIAKDVVMRQSSGCADPNREPPRRRGKRNSYTEQVDEAAKLLESEPVEVERELPAEDNSSVERAEPHLRPPSPLFED